MPTRTTTYRTSTLNLMSAKCWVRETLNIFDQLRERSFFLTSLGAEEKISKQENVEPTFLNKKIFIPTDGNYFVTPPLIPRIFLLTRERQRGIFTFPVLFSSAHSGH